MPTGPISVELDVQALARFRKRVERYRGQPLQVRLEKGALEAARMLVPSIRAAAPVSPPRSPNTRGGKPKPPPGNLRRSIRARSVRATGGLRTSLPTGSGVSTIFAASQGRIASGFVGPMSRIAPHRHLVIRGHRMVGHKPGKADTGYRSVANPFVDEAVRPRAAESMRVVSRAIFGEG